jgi:cation diffusion facilitator family transporter
MEKAQHNLKVQKIIVALAIILFAVKIIAWFATHSVAILTDALESIANITASLIGLYSLYISAKPRDNNHPYGHGKAEFLSAAVEGALIISAGVIITYEAIKNFFHPKTLHQLDYGIILVMATAAINYIAGLVCIKTGKKNNSLALIASGKHLQSDAWSTIGITIGLLLILITKIYWLDSAVAILFAIIIIYTGYKILRSSVAGIMDETDETLLKKLVALLNINRKENWVDLHNVRIIKYGATLHIDCHLTVPWYLNVNEAHKEIDTLSQLVKNEFGEAVELFVHCDGCLEFSCSICSKQHCNVRKHAFVKNTVWTIENIADNNKHNIST